jgi:hypothetical protein
MAVIVNIQVLHTQELKPGIKVPTIQQFVLEQ